MRAWWRFLLDFRSFVNEIAQSLNFEKKLMMNRRSLGRRGQVINRLVEDNSIRSTERMTDTHQDTICRCPRA